jgi:hypothetical protein
MFSIQLRAVGKVVVVGDAGVDQRRTGTDFLS